MDIVPPRPRLSRRRCLALASAFTAWPAGAAAAEPGVTPGEVLIGQSITLQGGRNEYGVAVMDGVKACLDQANAAGGVHRRRVVLHTLDDQNQSAQAEANARALINQRGVFALFGPIEGGPSTAVMKAAVDLGVPLFGPMAGSPGLRRPYQPLVFPVRAEHREEFRALMRYGRERGMTRVAFLHSDSEVGLAHMVNVKAIADATGMQVVASLPIKSEVDDAKIDDIVRQLAQSQPHLMFNHGSAGIYERIIRKGRGAGLSTAFMAICSGSTQLAQKLGPMAAGMVFTQVVPSPVNRATQLTRDYQDSFRRAWPDKPFSYASLEGWFTARALVESLSAAGPQLTRPRWLMALHQAPIVVSGLTLRYDATEHRGSNFVDLAMYTRDERFLH